MWMLRECLRNRHSSFVRRPTLTSARNGSDREIVHSATPDGHVLIRSPSYRYRIQSHGARVVRLRSAVNGVAGHATGTTGRPAQRNEVASLSQCCLSHQSLGQLIAQSRADHIHSRRALPQGGPVGNQLDVHHVDNPISIQVARRLGPSKTGQNRQQSNVERGPKKRREGDNNLPRRHTLCRVQGFPAISESSVHRDSRRFRSLRSHSPSLSLSSAGPSRWSPPAQKARAPDRG